MSGGLFADAAALRGWQAPQAAAPDGLPFTVLTRQLGRDRGRFTVPEDFDRPLPDDVLADF